MTGREIHGQRIAIIGASGALGSRIARRLSGGGASVLVVGRDADTLRSMFSDAPLVVGDLGDATTGDRLVAAAQEHLGGLDGLINAAGVSAFGSLLDTPDEVIEEVFTTNVIGPAFLLRRVLPLLLESKGYVVNLSAVLAERPMAGMGAYSASKAALTALDRALRSELRRTGVDVLDVRPPHTETGLADRPVHGHAPRLPTGLDPDEVAARVVQAITDGEADLGSDAFGTPA